MATKDKAKDGQPLDKKRVKFIEWFRKYRDIYRAAERAGIAKSRACAVFNEPAVQDELERQEEAVRMERARVEVVAEKITNEEIDRELLSVIRLPVKEYGSLKLEAIRLGAVMTGRIQAGNTRAIDAQQGAEATQGGWSYRATVQVEEAAPLMPAAAALSASAVVEAVHAAIPETKIPLHETKAEISETPAGISETKPKKTAAGVIRVG